MAFKNFKVETDADGIALVTWDIPGRSMNVLDETSVSELEEIVKQTSEDANVKGVVITSGKEALSAGADLSMLEGMSRTYAQVLKDLSDRHFPEASKIVLVQDNLSTHKPASLYEAFPPAEARRLVERFEWHYTPKHGSWLNMAEAELSVLFGQCLDRRIPDKLALTEEVAAWQQHRNTKHTKADWQFTTADARIKLKRLYPAI